MKRFFRKQTEFTRNVLKMLSGAAGAHGLMFLATPVLARLFSKQDIGSLQLYISTVMIFGVVASLKYEMAIVLPEDDREAGIITQLAVLANFCVSSVLAVILMLFGSFLCRLLDAQILEPYVILIALGNLSFGLMQAFQYVLIRRKAFGKLAFNKLAQVFVSQGLAVLFGFFWPQLRILLIMQLIGWATAAVLVLLRDPLPKKFNLGEIWNVARKYSKFPTVNTLMVFTNTLSLQLPVFMLSRTFSAEVVAYYAMANRIVNFPLFLVGQSVRQVFFQSASEAYRKSADALKSIYLETVRKLSLVALPPLLIIVLAGPAIAGIYLGQNYTEAGVYMQIISFWMFFQFINSPISSTMTILNKQEIGLILILISLAVRFYIMIVFSQTPRQMLLALSIATGIFYLVYNLTIFILIQREAGK